MQTWFLGDAHPSAEAYFVWLHDVCSIAQLDQSLYFSQQCLAQLVSQHDTRTYSLSVLICLPVQQTICRAQFCFAQPLTCTLLSRMLTIAVWSEACATCTTSPPPSGHFDPLTSLSPLPPPQRSRLDGRSGRSWRPSRRRHSSPNKSGHCLSTFHFSNSYDTPSTYGEALAHYGAKPLLAHECVIPIICQTSNKTQKHPDCACAHAPSRVATGLITPLVSYYQPKVDS